VSFRPLFAGITLVAILVAGSAVHADPALPEIPASQLDKLPESVRAAIDEARRAVTEAVESGEQPGARAEEWGRLGDVLFVHGFDAPARHAYRQAADLAPAEFAWHYLLGMVELSAGNLAGAVEALDIALELEPDNHAARIRRGRAHLGTGALSAAESDFRRALALEPESAAALGGLGRVAVARERYGEAVEWLEKALAVEPAADLLQHPLGMAYRGLGEVDKARYHLGLRGDREPQIADPLLARVQSRSRSPQFYLQLGLDLADQGDLEGALAMMARVLRLEPGNTRALLNSGELLARLDRLDDAHAVFQRLAAAQPDSGQAYFYIGQVEELRGNSPAAIAAYRDALAVEETHVQARAALARQLLQNGEAEAALRHFEHLAETAGTAEAELRHRYWQAIAEIRAGRCDRARDILERARALSDQPVAALVDVQVRLRSTCLPAGAGERAGVVSMAEQLYETNPALHAETLAMAYAASGRFDEAVDLQMQAIFEAAKDGSIAGRPDLRENLARYESGKAAVVPYAPAHPLFGVPGRRE